VSIFSEQFDPVDLCLPKFFKAFHELKYVSNDVVAVMRSEPTVKGGLSPRSSNVEMLFKADFNRFGRESDIAIAELRPEPDPVDHASGWKSRRQDISAVQRPAVTTCS
jgi:hypothetical protein